MRRMFSDADYPDRMLVDDMAAGFWLVGEAPTLCPPGEVHSSPHTCRFVDEVVAGAALARDACPRATKSSGCRETGMALWSKTLEELDRVWLVGPIDSESLEGAKLRPIDD